LVVAFLLAERAALEHWRALLDGRCWPVLVLSVLALVARLVLDCPRLTRLAVWQLIQESARLSVGLRALHFPLSGTVLQKHEQPRR